MIHYLLSLYSVRVVYYLGMKILVVEDDVKLASAIKRGLVDERINVEIAYDTDAAASFVDGEKYDVIVLDWMLPGALDGVGFCSKLREDNNQTPVIMLTARGATRDKIKGLNTGADDYLVKPCGSRTASPRKSLLF